MYIIYCFVQMAPWRWQFFTKTCRTIYVYWWFL